MTKSLKRLTALVNGTNAFIKDYDLMPDIAMVHPTTAKQIEAELKEVAKGSAIASVVRKLTIKIDSGVSKDNIIFLMKDGSL